MTRVYMPSTHLFCPQNLHYLLTLSINLKCLPQHAIITSHNKDRPHNFLCLFPIYIRGFLSHFLLELLPFKVVLLNFIYHITVLQLVNL
jgi:hypothetical protein